MFLYFSKIMFSVVIITLEGYIYPDLTMVKSMMLTDLNGRSTMYNFASNMTKTSNIHNWPSIGLVERNFHGIPYWKDGMDQKKVVEIIQSYHHNSLIISPNTQTADIVWTYVSFNQVIDIQSYGNH